MSGVDSLVELVAGLNPRTNRLSCSGAVHMDITVSFMLQYLI